MNSRSFKMKRLGILGLLVALGSAAWGCGINTDPAVFVEASIESPSASLTQGTLVSTISGSLTVHLHLGPRAADASEVKLGVLSVQDPTRTTTFVPTLGVQTSPPFPVAVDIDSDVVVAVSFAAQDNQLETATYDAVCAADNIVISGALDDSLRGGTISVASASFAPSGCP